jgi:peptidoglycan/xylan/chitin deacetylase (PgdA/CDA1 family)
MDSRRAILTYHSLDDSGSVISVPPAVFLRQLRALADSGITVARLAELRSTPAPAVALTFDDGFQNFADTAVPALAQYGFPATVFVVTNHCGGKNDWSGQPPGIPRLPLMSWPVIQELSRAGVEFGAHSASHPHLLQLNDRDTREEILSSKHRVEEATGRPALAFAYPYGEMPERARAIVAEHFSAGCSTRLGWVSGNSRPEALERLDVYYLSALYFFRHLFGRPARWYLGLRGALREWK